MAGQHMSSPESSGYASYLVRLWREDVQASNSGWQGEVQHIQSGGRWQFHTLAELLHFLSVQYDNERDFSSGTDL